MTWATLIMALVGPMAVRVIIALGFTAVTFTGVTVTANALISTAQSNWTAIPVAVLQLASLSGIPEFLGMIFGALVARLAMWATVAMTRYIATPH
ncbi:hypothetical protein GALL_71060 [mine drainage metagenome]|uniref:DUF2523 domain-containing protein n=1 Tax=mine drainage metagenome TaxID=410659 RepID=A0A1J5SQZ7_9ZZZZ